THVNDSPAAVRVPRWSDQHGPRRSDAGWCRGREGRPALLHLVRTNSEPGILPNGGRTPVRSALGQFAVCPPADRWGDAGASPRVDLCASLTPRSTVAAARGVVDLPDASDHWKSPGGIRLVSATASVHRREEAPQRALFSTPHPG